ncbi:hypothetical protein TPE_2390 [Treponema pedis str. T A4]|uniref:Uncharacterized protein n=1 Tax=Treponema pedis str. T A4 TaxID=1291379 RepID=S6A931_9SPIR|nr:hypothetical protein TPE_2390 [Treponema pedis str. T A4]
MPFYKKVIADVQKNFIKKNTLCGYFYSDFVLTALISKSLKLKSSFKN